MGQTLTRRPISQQKSFATMGTPSSPFAPDQSQYQGFTTPQQPQSAQIDQATLQMPTSFQIPSVLGRGFNQGLSGFRGRQYMMEM
jgi:hypothetical protein